MRMLFSAVLMLSVLLGSSSRAAEIPVELQGVWATAESEFEADRLIGGTALYVMPEGKVVLVGAPLPVGRCADGSLCTPIIGIAGKATYSIAPTQLILDLRDGTQSARILVDYIASEKVVLLRAPSEVSRLLRKSSSVPRVLAEKFNSNL